MTWLAVTIGCLVALACLPSFVGIAITSSDSETAPPDGVIAVFTLALYVSPLAVLALAAVALRGGA